MRNQNILALCVFSLALLLGLDSSAQAQTGDRGLTDGFWGTRVKGNLTMLMVFSDNGRCVMAFAKQGTVVKKIPGRYEVQGNEIFMRMKDGRKLRMRFAIRGDRLLLKDASGQWILVRLRR